MWAYIWKWISVSCCIAGLLRCGQTCLQWGWWQTLCKSAQSSLWNAVPPPHSNKGALQHLGNAIDFYFSVPSPQIASFALEETRGASIATESASKTLLSLLKAVLLCVYQVAALRSVLSGERGYEPARWDEVILSVFIKVICSCESSANLALYSNNNESVRMSHVNLSCQHWMGLRCTFELEPVGAWSETQPDIKMAACRWADAEW